MSYIILKNISKIYDGEIKTKALDNVNFEIEKGTGFRQKVDSF